MLNHDDGATVRLAATIARSRYDAEDGVVLTGLHSETLVEMALAAKREVDGLRTELAERTQERDAEADAVTSQRAEIRQLRKELAEARDLLTRAVEVRDEEIRRSSHLASDVVRIEAERDAARTSNGMYGTQLRRAGADLAKAEAARDVAEFAYSGALAELSDALGSKHLTMASAIAYVRGRVAELARERDARPDISPESANAVVDWWDSDNAPSTADVCAAIAILRAHAARATKGGE